MIPRCFIHSLGYVRDYLFVSTLFLLLVSMASCKKEDQKYKSPIDIVKGEMPHQAEDQNTPEAVLRKIHYAVLNNNRKQFRKCYRIPSGGEAYLDAIFDDFVAQYKLVEAIKKAYGKEGMAYYKDVRTCKEVGMYTFLPPPIDKPWWEHKDVGIQNKGDGVCYYDPYLNKECKMTRADGVWCVVLVLPKYASWEAECHKMLTKTIYACLPDVGKSGVTIDDIRRKTGKLVDKGIARLGPKRDI